MENESLCEDEQVEVREEESIEIENEQPIYKPNFLISKVWNYFGFKQKLTKQQLSKSANSLPCVCTVCSKEFKYQVTGTTSNLKKHLLTAHDIDVSKEQTAFEPSSKKSKQSDNQPSLTTFLAGKIPYSRNSHEQKKLEEAVQYMVAHDLQPTSIVEDLGFRHLMSTANPRFSMPSRTTITKNLHQVHEHEICALKGLLKEASFICLTTDSWTSRTADNYTTITCHYVEPIDWKLMSHTLETDSTPDSHTAEYLCNLLKAAVDKWKLDKDENLQLVITTDNAANISKAVKDSGYFHIGCLAHTLHLAVSKAMTSHQELNNQLARMRKVVKYFHTSSQAKAVLVRKQVALELPEHALIHDVPTRWNSTYLMLHRFIEQHTAVWGALSDLANGKVMNYMEPLMGSINSLKCVCALLKPYKDATELFSSQAYPTCSLILPIQDSLLKKTYASVEDPPIVSAMKSYIFTDLSTRYRCENQLKFLKLCSLMDPRFKELPFLSIEERDATLSHLSTILLSQSSAPERAYADAAQAA